MHHYTADGLPHLSTSAIVDDRFVPRGVRCILFDKKHVQSSFDRDLTPVLRLLLREALLSC